MNNSNLGIIHPQHPYKEPEPSPGPPDYDPIITRYSQKMNNTSLGIIHPHYRESSPEPSPGPADYNREITRYSQKMNNSELGVINDSDLFSVKMPKVSLVASNSLQAHRDRVNQIKKGTTNPKSSSKTIVEHRITKVVPATNQSQKFKQMPRSPRSQLDSRLSKLPDESPFNQNSKHLESMTISALTPGYKIDLSRSELTTPIKLSDAQYNSDTKYRDEHSLQYTEVTPSNLKPGSSKQGHSHSEVTIITKRIVMPGDGQSSSARGSKKSTIASNKILSRK